MRERAPNRLGVDHPWSGTVGQTHREGGEEDQIQIDRGGQARWGQCRALRGDARVEPGESVDALRQRTISERRGKSGDQSGSSSMIGRARRRSSS